VKSKDVKVRAILNDAGGIEFEVDGVKAKQARLKLDKDSGTHAIDFKLQDHSGKGVQFDTANSGDPRELRYQLNFVAADGSKLDCDPIIDNGGGTFI
jgi:hypothetical protein